MCGSIRLSLSTGKQAVSHLSNLFYFWCLVSLNNITFWSQAELSGLLQQPARTADLSAAKSAKGTAKPLHLLSLSSQFSHHFQSCKGFSYLLIPLWSFCVCLSLSTPPLLLRGEIRYPSTFQSLLYLS